MTDISKQRHNIFLVIAGSLSLIAAILHIYIIFGGADRYRFFGAGEEMAVMAEQGSWIPPLITMGVASVLILWAAYAFSGANLLPQLPLLRPALLIVSAIYLVRGLLLIPLWLGWLDGTEQSGTFWFWSSAICLFYGCCYALGTRQAWKRIQP